MACPTARAAFGRGHHEREHVALHQPVGDVLLDVLQRHALEDRALRVGVEEAGGDSYFQHDQVRLDRRGKNPLEILARALARIG